MPLYDLVCPKCGREEKDVWLANGDNGKNGQPVVCLSCGCIMDKRPPVFNPVFKGGGWTPKFGGQ